MTGSDQAPTSIRGLLASGSDDDAVAREMKDKLPAEGMAQSHVHGGSPLLRGTYALLDSKVLLAAARCLDQDVAGPFATWLATFQELRGAAARSLADPEAEEIVVLDVRRRVEVPQDVTVRVVADDGGSLGAFPFRLLLTAELGRTQVVIREGAVHTVDCVAAALAASLSFSDVSPPLWKRSAPDLALHLPLPRPVRVPLVP